MIRMRAFTVLFYLETIMSMKTTRGKHCINVQGILWKKWVKSEKNSCFLYITFVLLICYLSAQKSINAWTIPFEKGPLGQIKKKKKKKLCICSNPGWLIALLLHGFSSQRHKNSFLIPSIATEDPHQVDGVTIYIRAFPSKEMSQQNNNSNVSLQYSVN